MCSVSQTSDVPSSVVNTLTDNQSSSLNTPNNIKSAIEPSTSTPELNLLLDKLTEILRFRSGYRRHFGTMQHYKDTSLSPSMINLKRLQSNSIELLDNNTADVFSTKLNDSSISTNAWKSTNTHYKPSFSNRSPHHHHHHHHYHHHHHHHHHHHRHQTHVNLSTKINNFERKRRLPCLLQRLIDEGNLIKEAVHRLKSQRFSHTFKLQQQKQNVVHTPSTPTIKISNQTLSILNSRSTPSASVNINIPQQSSNSPAQITSSPNRGISWLLSSSVFSMSTTSTTNCSSGNGSPLRTCCFSNTQDRTPMVIGIHDR